MEKIDRLGWAAGISFRIFGLSVGIRVRDPWVLDSLLSRVPAGWVPRQSSAVDRLYSVVTPVAARKNVRQFCLLYGDHSRLARTDDFPQLLETFESDLDLYIAANCSERVFVHAGAVRWKNRTILMPGPTHTGKTSLVAEFLRAGASFYSDDFAAIDGHGRVHSYPRPLSVRGQDGSQKKVSAADLGAPSAVPAPLSVVLFTEYLADAGWRPNQLSPGHAILRLLQNTPSAHKQPKRAISVLGRAIQRAELHAGFRGEKSHTVESIVNYLDRRSPS